MATAQKTRNTISLKGSTQIVVEFFVWLSDGKISKLVLAIKSKETTEVLERWQFDIQIVGNSGKESVDIKQPSAPEKTEKEVHAEIQAIIRQITASVTFLPMLDEKCACAYIFPTFRQPCRTFNIIVYADKDVEVPTTWSDSDPHLLKGGGEHVKLRSFSTNFHKVDALVAYRRNDDI
ncbi:DNA-binding protein [Endogone sp. FLAS-F59071]|nr:DNA-binding protein [Endogone sp. FLAS-F59071]|eukprot:RUS22030.1 DNA-binding protein [Endogone sp. FLAS-F59071]